MTYVLIQWLNSSIGLAMAVAEERREEKAQAKSYQLEPVREEELRRQ